VSVGYDGRAVLSGLNLRIDGDDRIALLGANGNGKSTLVKLLAGRLEPMGGKLVKAAKLKTGYFAQHQADEFDLSLTALEQAKRAMPLAPEQKVRAHLGRFGFSQERSGTKVGSLSGGEKARLLFALMAKEAPNILLLDEPTNHLDVESREALIRALNEYEGAVILVTHDPTLVELAADRLWLVGDGKVKSFDGDLDDYRNLLLERRRAARRNGQEKGSVEGRRDARKGSADKRVSVAPLKRALEEAERKLADLNKEAAALDRKLADPKLYTGPAAKMTELQTLRGKIGVKLETAEQAWLDAAAALEAAGPETEAA
jgi:ATP-binding cassette subfamily F protein 3